MELEELKEFLSKYVDLEERPTEGFNREIYFQVYDISYKIVWFKNESTLYIGQGRRPACIPFKYVYLDTTAPCAVGGNKSLGFSYTKSEKKSIFDREYPWEVFRIPLPLENELRNYIITELKLLHNKHPHLNLAYDFVDGSHIIDLPALDADEKDSTHDDCLNFMFNLIGEDDIQFTDRFYVLSDNPILKLNAKN